ncbi:DUF188 domain-containing protein [Lederbergia sp. NSJ-179]|uniref:DUF188 domain-containing protein n=1 Tax=Lederbergia sp. NSJ-179 TaxID=2931402 RepID=UPI0037C182A1
MADHYGWQVYFVASYDHKPADIMDKDHWIFVDPGRDSADLYIVNHILPNNILITQDIGLASLVMAKNVHVLSPRGKIYQKESIETALEFRYLSALERRKGNYGKGPRTFTEDDRHRFVTSLCELLSNFEGDSRFASN